MRILTLDNNALIEISPAEANLLKHCCEHAVGNFVLADQEKIVGMVDQLRKLQPVPNAN